MRAARVHLNGTALREARGLLERICVAEAEVYVKGFALREAGIYFNGLALLEARVLLLSDHNRLTTLALTIAITIARFTQLSHLLGVGLCSVIGSSHNIFVFASLALLSVLPPVWVFTLLLVALIMQFQRLSAHCLN